MHQPASQLVTLTRRANIAAITLNDPARRNALSAAMFDALESALHSITADASVSILVLQAVGPAFCAGFDLPSAVQDQRLLESFILRLSALLRSMRRAPQVTLARVHGPAVAGGCAIISACDFVFASPDAVFGYPVHPLGLSPAVTLPTLAASIGTGPSRALTMSGDLLDAHAAHRLGLATRLSASASSLEDEFSTFLAMLAAKPPTVLRTTKSWLNEIDGSLDDARFEAVARHSARATQSAETRALLAEFWARRSALR